jgi:mono/diheme cytochrome c family protein
VLASTGAGPEAALVAFARDASPASVPTRNEPATAAPSQAALNVGQAAFDRVCKSCHGAEASGDGAPRLVPFSREYAELLGIVREGAGQMPPISVRELPDDSVAAIVAYLKSLR